MTTSIEIDPERPQTSWQNQVPERKTFIIYLVLMGAALIIGVAVLVIYSGVCEANSIFKNQSQRSLESRNANAEGLNGNETCLTQACRNSAKEVLTFIDQSVDPCDDFYQFACGKFLSDTTIPEDKAQVTSLSILRDALDGQIKTLLEEPLSNNASQSFRKLIYLYDACMNEAEIERDGLANIQVLIGKLGGWPVLVGDQWNESDFDWKRLVSNFRKTGYNVNLFIDISVTTDYRNSSNRIISLGPASSLFSGNVHPDMVDQYYNYMVDVAVVLGADEQVARRELNDSLQFEKELSQLVEQSAHSYNTITLNDLQREHPDIALVNYINDVLNIDDIEVSLNETIMITNQYYISRLKVLLNKTSKRVLANYGLWTAVDLSVPFLTRNLRFRRLGYTANFNGVFQEDERWKYCVNVLTKSLPPLVSSMYVRKHFREDAKSYATEMVADIQKELKNMLESVGWMDNITRQHALEKLDVTTAHIGYPNELLDDTVLDAVYTRFQLTSGSYLESYLNYTKFIMDYSFGLLRKPVNKTYWIDYANSANVNAYYSLTSNSIVLPAGVLQGVFFDRDRPRYMNYGGIGFVIGHEMTHGFDNIGRQYDQNGIVRNWWQNNTGQEFLQRSQCMVNQYNNYTNPEISVNVNGANTLSENIADNGGVKEAYLAYKSWVKRNAPEKSLPGLERYSPEQMFWISSANVWCSEYRPELLLAAINILPYSPARFRVHGPLSNNENFARDFDCPLGSKMNPAHKCAVW